MVSSRKVWQERCFWLILLVITVGLVEVTSFTALKIASHFLLGYSPLDSKALHESDRNAIRELLSGKEGYFSLDDTLGWSIRPSTVTAEGQYRSNSQGLRADRDYSMTPSGPKLRLAAFGDSFTHGDEVRAPDTWEEQINQSDPRYEVLNFGVGGYGLDQAYLRYRRDGVKFKPDIVLVGFMSENINRVVNVFRPFYTPGASFALSKPRYILGPGGRLVLQENPLKNKADYQQLLDHPESIVPIMGERDHWYQIMPFKSRMDRLAMVRLFKTGLFLFRRTISPFSIVGPDGVYRQDGEAIAVTKEIFRLFYSEIVNNGAIPVIVLLPSHRDILRYRKNSKKRYAPLIEFFEKNRMHYVDLLDGFRLFEGQYEAGGLLSHYSKSENSVVARYLLQHLNQKRLYDRAHLKTVLDEEEKRWKTK
jgi:hypothetical protein